MMNIQRCFDILDLPPGATREEARRAYKDIVSVWHPDRFSHNPRLKKKAELKLKEINGAYREVKAFIASRDMAKAGAGRASDTGPGPSRNSGDDHERDAIEAVAEAGTRLVLGAWSRLSKVLRRLNEERSAPGKAGGSENNGEKG